MKKLTGTKIEKLDFTPIKQGDLLYHEGPLLSVFKDEFTGSLYFYKWSDSDEKAHRWLVFKVLNPDLKAFFEKKYSLRDLVIAQPFVYALDLDNDLKPQNIFLLSTQNIPKSYLPDKDSHFDSSDFEDYAIVLDEKLKEKAFLAA